MSRLVCRIGLLCSLSASRSPKPARQGVTRATCLKLLEIVMTFVLLGALVVSAPLFPTCHQH